MKLKYSLVNGERSEAKPKLKGECELCGSPTIARCGIKNIWHWAHKGKLLCDPWWENETEWHRAWKDLFPKEWQEIIQYAPNGEKHIADVKTAQDWVIEFQHSFLEPEERNARNAFYGKLVWVVDGIRRKRDKKQFFDALNEVNPRSKQPEMRMVYLEYGGLLTEWSGINAPVFFDFGDENLYCLLPINQKSWGHVVVLPKREFIALHNRPANHTENFEEFLKKLYSLFTSSTERNLVQPQKQITSRAPQKLDPLEMLRRAMLQQRARGINPYAPRRR